MVEYTELWICAVIAIIIVFILIAMMIAGRSIALTETRRSGDNKMPTAGLSVIEGGGENKPEFVITKNSIVEDSGAEDTHLMYNGQHIHMTESDSENSVINKILTPFVQKRAINIISDSVARADNYDAIIASSKTPDIRAAFDGLDNDGHLLVLMDEWSDDFIRETTQFPGALYLGCIPCKMKPAPPRLFCIWLKVDDLPTLNTYNPPLVLTPTQGDMLVVRDDTLIGGTKQRAAIDLFRDMKNDEFVYASPSNGFAQVALALAGKLTGKKATVFVAKTRPLTKQTIQALRLGAKIVEVAPKTRIRELGGISDEYAARVSAATAKLGFDDDAFSSALAANITTAAKDTKLADRNHPYTIWVVGGSAVLTRVLYRVFPQAKFNVVQVGKLIDELLDYSRSKLYVAPEFFYKNAKVIPPYPSVASYDAKVWQFAKEHGRAGDIIWNVAKDPILHDDNSKIAQYTRKKGAAQPTDIEREYQRYRFVMRILNSIRGIKKSVTKRESYEFKNIIERWLLSSANFSNDKFDAIFSNDLFADDCRFNAQMIHELTEKKILDAPQALQLVKKIQSIVREYKDAKSRPLISKKGQIQIGGDEFRYKDYIRKINPDRIKFLQSMGSADEIGVMLMRYASILPGSQHWNMPVDNFRLYHDKGVRIEGFSSPVNSQLITIDPECTFCSLFPDVDAPFGSMGNFFDVDYIDKTVAVGPPYTVELFDRIYEKTHSTCERAEREGRSVKFYITFSAWRDTTGYNAIKDSKYCHFAAIMNKYNHFYVNTNNPALPEITATFDTVLFVMSYGVDRLADEEYLGMLRKMSYDKPHDIIKSIDHAK